MRQLLAAAAALVVTVGFGAAPAWAGKVQVKGLHLCCGQCEGVVKKLLAKVDGVADVEADRDEQTVTFTAKDKKAAYAGVKALMAGGFFGATTEDGNTAFKLADKDYPKKGDKADEITIKGVHACCGRCDKALKDTFKDQKVTLSDKKGAQKDITISGKDLDKAAILEALRKAGFNGTIAK